jgi:hypothetical protein
MTAEEPTLYKGDTLISWIEKHFEELANLEPDDGVFATSEKLQKSRPKKHTKMEKSQKLSTEELKNVSENKAPEPPTGEKLNSQTSSTEGSSESDKKGTTKEWADNIAQGVVDALNECKRTGKWPEVP